MRLEKLENIASIQIGKTPKRAESKYWGKGHPWVSISDLKERIIISTKEEITDLAVKECRCKMIPKDTLLMSFKLSIGKLAFAGTNFFTNEAICGLQIKNPKQVDPNYLYYALKNTKLIGSNVAAKGSTLNTASLKALRVPLAEDISTQRHITNILSKAENLIAQRKESIDLLDEYLKSAFLEMFGDPVRNENGWKVIPFNNVGKFKSGGTPSKSRADFWEGDFPWVSPKDMKVSKIWDSQDHISELVFEETNLKRIPRNHLLIVVRGMILAHSFPIAINDVEVAINQDMKAIQPINDLSIVYLQHCLNAMKRQILNLISSAGHGTRKFDTSAMQKLLIPLPSIKLQSKFAQIVEKTEALKAQYRQSLQELENLYGSLSQRAFKGELKVDKNEESLLMAAEPVITNQAKHQSAIPKNRKGFAKQVLGGKIVSLFKDDPNFTHIKFQKLQYLAEHIAEEDLFWNYYRQAAGPHDNKFRFSVIAKLNQNKWFEEQNYKFYPLPKLYDIERFYQNYFSDRQDKLNELFKLLKNASEKFCEAIATIYAVWNNHIILNKSFDKADIKSDFFDWSSRKEEKFTDDEFEKALVWMQKHNIVPTGFGQLIKEKAGKK